ncbi:kinase-like domain-containing protein [Mucidula mucida]|nr:kinase-like domain-containing protein [Mucidula mucida]
MPLDLSRVDDVKQYLSEGPFEASDITLLSGGNTNFVYRLCLSVPYEGHRTLVFKHGKAFSATNETISLELGRQKFEAEAMRWVNTWLPASSVATVPKIHLFDEEAHCMIMDDCGEGTMTLKQFILDGRCSPTLSKKVGNALGEFLSHMHTRSKADNNMREMFKTNIWAKKISAWVEFGQLEATLSGKDGLPSLEDPPLEVSNDDFAALAAFASEAEAAIVSATEYFVMGDFWPGNIVIKAEGDVIERLSIVDWELAKTGLPGHDLGQFCAEAHLIRCFYPPLTEVATVLIDSLLEAYANHSGPGDLTSDSVLFRDMLALRLTHLVIWTPRIPWGSKSKTREVVMEGFRGLKLMWTTEKDKV